MELRHIRYFLAVAEAGSLSVAADQILHTSQPSLSRQIRDLEDEVGTPLFTRSARGIELTPAGRSFLDHARSVLSQVNAATQAARQTARPARPCFTLGFLTGHELAWMPETLQILSDELPNVDVRISNQYSPALAEALMNGMLDAAFMRREAGTAELAYEVVDNEPMIVYLPSDHRLAQRETIRPEELDGEVFITTTSTAPVLRAAMEDFLKQSNINPKARHEVEHMTMAMSMIASTRGVSVLPSYLKTFLPWAVTTRPLEGAAPSIDLVLGYKKSNQSPILKLLRSRLKELSARVLKQNR